MRRHYRLHRPPATSWIFYTCAGSDKFLPLSFRHTTTSGTNKMMRRNDSQHTERSGKWTAYCAYAMVGCRARTGATQLRAMRGAGFPTFPSSAVIGRPGSVIYLTNIRPHFDYCFIVVTNANEWMCDVPTHWIGVGTWLNKHFPQDHSFVLLATVLQ